MKSAVRLRKSYKANHPTIAWHPGGNDLIAISRASTVNIQDIENNSLVTTLYSDHWWIESISWAPNTKYLASAGREGAINIWDIEKEELVIALTDHDHDHDCKINVLKYSPNGEYLASGDSKGVTKIWDTMNYDCICTLGDRDDEIVSIAWSPDGNYFVTNSGLSGSITIYDSHTRKPHITLASDVWVTNVAWSSDSRFLAVSRRYRNNIGLNNIGLIDIEQKKYLGNVGDHYNSIESLAWSPDDHYLVSGSSDCTIKIWNIEDNTCMAKVKRHGGCVQSVAWSPSGRDLAVAAVSAVKIWDVSGLFPISAKAVEF